MRYYPVPFSSKGEDRLFFNLTIQESLIIGSGICVGLLAAKIVSVFAEALILVCLPAAIPFVAAGILFVIVPIRHVDGQISLFQYCLRRIEFNRRPRHLLRERGLED
jgi:hypothetical protein